MALPFLFRKGTPGQYISDEEYHPTTVENQGSAYLLILFLITITLRFISITAVINFTTTYLVHEISATPGIANLMAGFVFLGGMLLTPLFGILSDRYKPINLFLVTTGLSAPTIILLSLASKMWVITIILFIAGIVFYASSPPMDMLLSSFSGYMGRGEAFGYAMSVFAVLTALSPALFGLIADRIGLRYTITLFSIPPFLSFFVLLYTARKLKRHTPVGNG